MAFGLRQSAQVHFQSTGAANMPSLKYRVLMYKEKNFTAYLVIYKQMLKNLLRHSVILFNLLKPSGFFTYHQV